MEVPQRPIVRANVHDMRNHIFRRRDSFPNILRIWRLAREALLEKSRHPRRPVAESFNLFVLDKDRVAANPIVAAKGAVEDLRISHAAVVGLCIGQQRSLRELLELSFEHLQPRALGGLVVRERIIGERPGMAFAPESVHKSIDKLDDRISVELRSHRANQIAKCTLKERIVVTWLIT